MLSPLFARRRPILTVRSAKATPLRPSFPLASAMATDANSARQARSVLSSAMFAMEEQRRSLVAMLLGGGGAASRKPEGKQSAGSTPQPRPYLPMRPQVRASWLERAGNTAGTARNCIRERSEEAYGGLLVVEYNCTRGVPPCLSVVGMRSRSQSQSTQK